MLYVPFPAASRHSLLPGFDAGKKIGKSLKNQISKIFPGNGFQGAVFGN
jgi:hypothetical protein